jgi:16S rRNA (guanine966-N2)-methyltransferase
MRTAWIALPAAAPRAGSAVALCGQHHAAGNGARRRSAAAKNLATLKASHGKVVNTNTLNYLNQPGTPHHIVFVDPPFRKGLLEETLRLLENNGWLADEALIYVESEVENGLPPVPACWHLYREKVAGQVAYRLYQREVKGENHAD